MSLMSIGVEAAAVRSTFFPFRIGMGRIPVLPRNEGQRVCECSPNKRVREEIFKDLAD